MPKRSHLVLKMAEGPRPFRNPLCTWTPGMATFEGTRSPKCCPWTNQGHLTFQHTPPWPRPSPWDAYTRAYTNRGDPARLIRERPRRPGPFERSRGVFVARVKHFGGRQRHRGDDYAHGGEHKLAFDNEKLTSIATIRGP
jgi:hypothetical protein